jgi:hypothetical protein
VAIKSAVASLRLGMMQTISITGTRKCGQQKLLWEGNYPNSESGIFGRSTNQGKEHILNQTS